MQSPIQNEGRSTLQPDSRGLFQGALIGLLVGLIAIALYMLRLEPVAQNVRLPSGSASDTDLDSFTQGLSEGRTAALNRRLELGLDR